MTAPGNDAVLITLLATLTAGLGYVAGRLHQWYRTVLDRDEAYRDGYDTATRSVFGMAARMIRPGRGVRGTAVVSPPAAAAAPLAPPVASPGSSAPAVSAGRTDGERGRDPGVSPAPAEGGGLAVPAAVGANPARHFARSSSPGAAARKATSAPSAAAMSAAVLSASGSAAARKPAPAEPASPAPAALAASPGPGSPSPGAGGDEPAPAGRADGEPEAAGVDGGAPAAGEGGAGGRHFVPDELVRAATYRLTPDRVARAKVREAVTGDEEGQETTRLSSVPRPRAS